jgi:hypothetical protein
VVQATNHAARLASGDILLYLSDDFDCPQQWDDEIAKVAPPQPEYMIWVNDCVQGMNTVLTIPIMSKGLYQALGYFWHPDYLSMWVDVDLWHVCKRRNVLVLAHHLRFEHKHYSVGKAKYDETYQNHDNPQRKQQGWEVFCRRQADNFITDGAIK